MEHALVALSADGHPRGSLVSDFLPKADIAETAWTMCRIFSGKPVTTCPENAGPCAAFSPESR
jgi:hypothetical protein